MSEAPNNAYSVDAPITFLLRIDGTRRRATDTPRYQFMDTVTDKEAFLAMYAFLEEYYKQTHSDDVGGLLGELSLLPDGGTADPAAWHDWLQAIQKAKEGKVDAQLRLRRP